MRTIGLTPQPATALTASCIAPSPIPPCSVSMRTQSKPERAIARETWLLQLSYISLVTIYLQPNQHRRLDENLLPREHLPGAKTLSAPGTQSIKSFIDGLHFQFVVLLTVSVCLCLVGVTSVGTSRRRAQLEANLYKPVPYLVLFLFFCCPLSFLLNSRLKSDKRLQQSAGAGERPPPPRSFSRVVHFSHDDPCLPMPIE